MTVFVVESYLVKPDKIEQNNTLLQKLAKLLKEKPTKFNMVKSYKTFSDTFGTWGYSLEFWEMNDFSDWNKIFEMMMQDSELKKFPEEFFSIIIPGTHQLHVMAQTAEYTSKK
jgi:hypothetical protein